MLKLTKRNNSLNLFPRLKISVLQKTIDEVSLAILHGGANSGQTSKIKWCSLHSLQIIVSVWRTNWKPNINSQLCQKARIFLSISCLRSCKWQKFSGSSRNFIELCRFNIQPTVLHGNSAMVMQTPKVSINGILHVFFLFYLTQTWKLFMSFDYFIGLGLKGLKS